MLFSQLGHASKSPHTGAPARVATPFSISKLHQKSHHAHLHDRQALTWVTQEPVPIHRTNWAPHLYSNRRVTSTRALHPKQRSDLPSCGLAQEWAHHWNCAFPLVHPSLRYAHFSSHERNCCVMSDVSNELYASLIYMSGRPRSWLPSRPAHALNAIAVSF